MNFYVTRPAPVIRPAAQAASSSSSGWLWAFGAFFTLFAIGSYYESKDYGREQGEKMKAHLRDLERQGIYKPIRPIR